MSDSGDSVKARKKREYNRNAQRLFRQRRKEHLKKLEAASRERASSHTEELDHLRREVNELQVENENLRTLGSQRASPVPYMKSSPSSYATSPFPAYEAYNGHGVGELSSHSPHSQSLPNSDAVPNLCVLFPRDIAEVRRDLHEMMAPILDLNILTDPQLHLRTLATLGPSLPAALQPTYLQLQTPHHIYIDLIPSPLLRDELIKAGFETANAFLTEVCTFVYETEDHKQVIIWGEDYLSEFSWEFSEEVLNKWGDTILRGDWRSRTNFWRRQRNIPLIPE